MDLVMWDSNYYRYSSTWNHAALEDSPGGFRQVYLRYQDMPNHAVTFDIDDSEIIENGFTCSHVGPGYTGNFTLTLTNANPSCVKYYVEERSNSRVEVDIGQCFGLDWVHVGGAHDQVYGIDRALRFQMPGGVLFLADAPFQEDSPGRLWVYHLRPPGSTWIVRIYRIAWEKSKIRLRMEVFRDPHFQNGLHGWNAYNVEVGDFHVHTDHYCDHS